MASPLFSIPRFLLPRSGLIWRRPNLGNGLRNSELLVVRRNASNTAKDANAKKQIVLEKPVKFNPPSHGARLPKGNRPQQQHYGGVLSAEEILAQRAKDYPGLPPPKDSFGHWFMYSRTLHTVLPIGTLVSLCLYSAIENFKAKSPYTDMLPTWSDFFKHPITSTFVVYEVWRLDTMHQTAVTAKMRKKETDDMLKRQKYRRAHGLDDGFFSVKEDDEEPKRPLPEEKREKFLGIF